MKAFKKKLSMLLAVSAMAFGVGLKSNETRVAKAASTTVTMDSFTAASGSLDNVVSYTTDKGGGTAAPLVSKNEIRLYQNSGGTGGGTITISVTNDYSLTEVIIGSSMSTSIAYTTATNTTKSTTESLAANGKYTVSSINDSSITFYCMGKTSSNRLCVNYLSVSYDSIMSEEEKEKADKDAAQAVVDLINSLPSADSITDYSTNNDYVAAKEAYDSLTDIQKGYVGSEYVTKLNAVGEKLQEYKPLMYEIKMGETLKSSSELSSAKALETAYETPNGISWSGTPVKAYGKVTDALRLGTKSDKGNVTLSLDSNDYYIEVINISARNWEGDSGSKLKVVCGSLEITHENELTGEKGSFEFDVSEAQSSSIQICGEGRAHIYAITVYYAKHTSSADQAKINEVIDAINNIGEVEATLICKNAIENAEKLYSELKTAEQELVTNYSTLTSARTSFDALTNSTNEFEGISNTYNPYTIKAAGLNIDANLAGGNNKIGINSNSMSKSITTENIASVIGVETNTTGIVTLHSYFYNGFFSLDLIAEDKIEGTLYYLTSSDGGLTYTKATEQELNVETGKEINLAITTKDITDLVVVFKLSNTTKNAQRMSLSSLTYYSNANAEDAETLIELIAGLDTCKEYDQAETCREFYNELSDYEKIVFNRATIVDNEKDTNKEVSVNALDKLMYMEYLTTENAKSTESSLNLFTGNNSNNMTLILIVGLLGLSAVAAYYFLNKKKYSC